MVTSTSPCWSYWLFDPGSGRFVTNALTAELRNLMHHGLTLDARRKEIRVSLWIGTCPDSFEIYRIENAGQTHLNGNAEQAHQVGVIPTGIELFAFDAALLGFLPFQQV
jgi:hypothetical protein